MRKRIGFGGATLSVFALLTSCNTGTSLTCGTGTRLVGDQCISDTTGMPVDMAVVPVPDQDMTPVKEIKCGPNTALNAAGDACEIASSACLDGTSLDPKTGTCYVPIDYGTEIYSSSFTELWSSFARLNPNPVDGGSLYQTLGPTLPGGLTVANPKDDDKLFMSISFAPVGAINVPVRFLSANSPPGFVPTQVDHQLTLGEWKKCKANVKIYKDPPSSPGKKYYKEVVDLAGCVPDTVWSVWHNFSTSKLNKDRQFSTPAGAIPNTFEINSRGQGHWERDMDPVKYYKMGTEVPGLVHSMTQNKAVIPDTATFPDATMGFYLIFHNTGQSNANPGNCTRDMNNQCVTPPDTAVVIPGQFGVTAAAVFFTYQPETDPTACSGGAGKCNSIPLGMIQPY